MGNLYQLHAQKSLTPGSCVFVNGPYDTFGVIVKALEGLRDDLRLYLIRGTGNIAADYPAQDTVAFTDYGNRSIKVTSSYDDLFCNKCHQKL